MLNAIKKITKNLGIFRHEQTDMQTISFAKSFNDNVTLQNIIAELKNFYFLANKGNLGDVLIACAEYQYFETNKFDYKIFDKNKMPKEPFNLIYGGGGIWTKYYKDYYSDILDILKSPMLERCVILPSSFWECEDLMEILDYRFTVFCRDENSYNYCIQNNSQAKFYLADDMVVKSNFDIFRPQKFFCVNKFNPLNNNFKQKRSDTFLEYFKVYKRVKKIKPSRTGYLLRNDCERYYKIGAKDAFDLSGFWGGECNDIGQSVLLGKTFLSAIDMFDIIVTDRLHVGICAAKLGKEVLLLDNTYKKISSVYNYSLKEMPNIHFVNKDTFKQELIYCSQFAQKTSNNTIFKTLPKNRDEYYLQYESINQLLS